jgi:hypothetical protein
MAIDDADVAMYSCNACDQRWWDANGLTTSLSSVLDLVAHSGRRRGGADPRHRGLAGT